MRTASSLLLICCCAAGAFAREESSRDFRKTVPLPAGRTFRLEHSLGNVTVRTQPGQDAAIQAYVKCSAGDASEARACADRIRIDVVETPSGVSVRTVYPPGDGFFKGVRNLSYTVSYDIALPETAPLEVRCRFGSVSVTGLHAPATINSANGKVSFSGGRGRQRIENSFGEVSVEGNDGDLTVVNANGNVSASNITGTLGITDRFGRVQVSNAGGSLTVHNANGNVDVQRVGGFATISSSFGAVTVADARSGLVVQNQNGAVDARDVAGSAELHTSFAPVRFARIGKALTVRAQNSPVTGDTMGESASVETSFATVDLAHVKGGARVTAGNTTIRLTDIGGEVYAKTSFGGVSVDGAGGPVTVENANGSVTVKSKAAPPCQPISLRSSFAPLSVSIPPNTGYNLNARTSFGRIHSDLDLTVNGAISTDSITAKIGGGGCDLTLINRNGSIDILKARP